MVRQAVKEYTTQISDLVKQLCSGTIIRPYAEEVAESLLQELMYEINGRILIGAGISAVAFFIIGIAVGCAI